MAPITALATARSSRRARRVAAQQLDRVHLPLAVVRCEVLDLRECLAIQAVRIAESLREQLQSCRALIGREGWFLRSWSGACSDILHTPKRSVHAGP
jgi:hypothetical protein